jgi:hypothetical protein
LISGACDVLAALRGDDRLRGRAQRVVEAHELVARDLLEIVGLVLKLVQGGLHVVMHRCSSSGASSGVGMGLGCGGGGTARSGICTAAVSKGRAASLVGRALLAAPCHG